MRVAFDVTSLIGPSTGVGNVVAEWFERLDASDDLEIIPYTLTTRGRLDLAGVHSLRLPAAVAVRLWNAVDRPRVDRRLGRPDLVHGTNYVVPAARAARLVSVYDLSFITDAAIVAPNVRRFDDAVRAAVRRGAHVHTTSNAMADLIADRYGASTRVVLPGIVPPEGRSEPIGDQGPPTILALGTATRRKNFPLLVRAFETVAAEIDDVRLVVAGPPGDDSDALRAAYDALSPAVRPNVELVGRVDDVEGLYSRAAVLAHPSRYEGFGLPVLEAMVRRTPVVAARGGAVPEVAGDAAVLVDVDDVDALANGLIAVLGDSQLRARLIDAGEQRAKGFTWQRSVDELIAVYQSFAT